MTLGEILKKLRERQGWSQIEVAKKLEVSGQVISNYERNYRTPDIEMMKKISSLFDVSTDFLLNSNDLKNTEYYRLLNEYLINSGKTIHEVAVIADGRSEKEGWNTYNDMTEDTLRKLLSAEELPRDDSFNMYFADIVGGDPLKLKISAIKLMGTEESKSIALDYETHSSVIDEMLYNFIKDISLPENDSVLARLTDSVETYETLKQMFIEFGPDFVYSLTLQAKIKLFIELRNKMDPKVKKDISIEINDDDLTDDEKMFLVDELENYYHFRKNRLLTDKNK